MAEEQQYITQQPQILAGKHHEKDLTKWLLNYSEELRLLYHDLKGEQEIEEDGESKWVQIGRPLMNDTGIMFLLSALRDTTCKDARLSDITIEDARRVAWDTTDSVMLALVGKYREFNLDLTNGDYINNRLGNIIYLSILRAVEGKERDAIHKGESTVRTITQEERPKKTGWLGMLNPLK